MRSRVCSTIFWEGGVAFQRNPWFLKRPDFTKSNRICSSVMEGNSDSLKNLAGLSSSAASGGGVGGGGGGSSTGASKVPMASKGGERNHFLLSPSTALKVQKGDITKWFVDGTSDAIVNAANEKMLGGGGVDGAIHRAAGPELLAACYDAPEVRPGVRCPKGEARITPAFRLPVSRVIHTVGPIYDIDDNPKVTLTSAYRSCLSLAKESGIHYIAFPAISCGVYGYPYDEAATIAISTVKEFAGDFKEVHFVLFSDEIHDVWLEKASGLL